MQPSTTAEDITIAATTFEPDSIYEFTLTLTDIVREKKPLNQTITRTRALENHSAAQLCRQKAPGWVP
jgi:hypothetical protein